MEDLIDKLKHYTKGGSPAERKIARYFSEHLADLPFETAASIADRLDLSPMTVGRFLRALGYQGLDGMHVELKSPAVTSAWKFSDRLDVLRKDLQDGRLMAELVAEQIETLHQLYDMTNQAIWRNAVQAIVSAREIFIASFQNIGGISHYFSEQLAYARDGVRYMDGINGTYLELFGRPSADALVIIIDFRRFATKSRILVKAARKAGYEVLLITDPYCDWARDGADITLMLPPARARTWDNSMGLTALLGFLVTSVIVAGGDDVAVRIKRIIDLQDLFGDFAR